MGLDPALARAHRRGARRATACPPGSTAEVATPAILEAMGRDKKADADGAQHGDAGRARATCACASSPPRDRLVAAIEELRG